MEIRERTQKYLVTHPWITFKFDSRKLSPDIWALLGEAASKCLHIIGTPLLPQVHQRLMSVFLAKGAHATTAIEGNTLSEEEVKQRIDGNLPLPPSKEYLGTEIDNIVKAVNLIGRTQLEGGNPNITYDQILEYNSLVLAGLPLDEGVVPGTIRTYPVGVARYAAPPADECEFLLRRYVQWLNEEFIYPTDQEMIFAILKAIVAHVYFEWIHPFGDGNGRTGRLIEFQVLLSAGFPATAAHLFSNHYNQTRTEYYRHLEMASATKGDLVPFIKYALQGFVDQLKAQIELIKDQQLYAHWKNYVFETFENMPRPRDKRRRMVILELSEKTKSGDDPHIKNLRHVSPKIAEQYARVSERTYQRDVERLKEMGLLLETKDGFSPNWELLRSFMPQTREREKSNRPD